MEEETEISSPHCFPLQTEPTARVGSDQSRVTGTLDRTRTWMALLLLSQAPQLAGGSELKQPGLKRVCHGLWLKAPYYNFNPNLELIREQGARTILKNRCTMHL